MLFDALQAFWVCLPPFSGKWSYFFRLSLANIVVYIISIIIFSIVKESSKWRIPIVSLIFSIVGLSAPLSLITHFGHCIIGFYLGQALFANIVFRDLNNALEVKPTNDDKCYKYVRNLKEDCLSVIKLVTEIFLALCIITGAVATILFSKYGELGNKYHIIHVVVAVVCCASSIYFFTIIPGYEFLLKIRKKECFV